MSANLGERNLVASSDHEGLAKRVIAGMSGQVFSRAVLAAATAIWVPLMLRAWGVTGYGEWIALTALASYLGYSNFGFVTPAANEIVMLAGAHDMERAKRLLQMSISFSLFVILPILAVVAIGLSTLDFQHRFHFTVLSNGACVVIIGATAWEFMAHTLFGVVVAPLYANGAYGRVYLISGLVRLVELIIVSGLLLTLRVSPATVACISSAASTINVIAMVLVAKRTVDWVSFRPHRLDSEWILNQLRPTLGTVLYNLSMQGILLLAPRALLSIVSGAGAVAVYALYGTMMRVVDQVVWIFIAPFEVEMARSVGSGDKNRAIKLIRVGSQSAWIVFATVSLAIAIVAPLVFPVWTHRQIPFDYRLLALACAMFGCSHLGKISAHALIATNRLYGPSFLILAWSIGALAIGLLLSIDNGVEGMFLGGILGELGVSVIAIYAVAKWLGVSIPVLLFDVSTLRSVLDLLARHGFKQKRL
jgi:hypothetical protein